MILANKKVYFCWANHTKYFNVAVFILFGIEKQPNFADSVHSTLLTYLLTYLLANYCETDIFVLSWGIFASQLVKVFADVWVDTIEGVAVISHGVGCWCVHGGEQRLDG